MDENLESVPLLSVIGAGITADNGPAAAAGERSKDGAGRTENDGVQVRWFQMPSAG